MSTFKIHINSQKVFSNSEQNFNTSKLYILDNDIKLNFINTVDLDFKLYKGQHIKIMDNSKIFINISLQYIFNNLSPDYFIQILENEDILYSEQNGISDYPNITNKITDEIILDIKNFDNLKIRLAKNDLSTNQILLKKNSYISYQQL